MSTLIKQFLFPVTDAPAFSKGFKASLGFTLGMCIWVIVVRAFELWSLSRKEKQLEGSSTTSEPETERIGVVPETKA